MPCYLSLDLGTVNFSLCHVTVTENRHGSVPKFKIHEWQLRNVCSSELNETDTVHMTCDMIFQMFPVKPPKVDYVLIELQHRINRTTEHQRSALLALFRAMFRGTLTQIHTPDAGLKVDWALEQYAHTGKLPSREKYARNYSFNKAVAREAMPLLIPSKAWQDIKKSCPKKDDLADCLLQAMAFDRYKVRVLSKDGTKRPQDPAVTARVKSHKLTEAKAKRDFERKELNKKEQKVARKRKKMGLSPLETKAEKKRRRKKSKKERASKRRKEEAYEQIHGGLAFVRPHCVSSSLSLKTSGTKNKNE